MQICSSSAVGSPTTLTVYRARRLMNGTVVLAAFGALTVATVSHRQTGKAPAPPKTPAMVHTVQPVEYCIEGYFKGQWLHMNSSGHVVEGPC